MRPLIAFVVGLLAAGAIVVIGLKIRSNALRPPTRTVVTTPIVSSPLTPLEARRAKRTGAAKSPDSATPRQSGASTSSGSRSSSGSVPKSTPQKRRSPPKGPKATDGTPKRPTSAQGHGDGTTSPSPQPQPQPLVDVTVPAPASACLKDLGGVNC